MANASTLLAGLGGGLGLWYLTRHTPATDRTTSGAGSGSTTGAASESPAPAATSSAGSTAARNGTVQLDARGVIVDGICVDVADAIQRCARMDHVELSVAPTASASTYAELMAALGNVNRPDQVRNASRGRRAKRSGRRARSSETATTFTLATYPEGVGGPRHVRWFRAEPRTTWEDARDRLAAAGLLDLRAVEPHLAGAWKLTSEAQVFRADRAEPLPPVGSQPRGARHASPRYTREGRTILRDGEAILYVDRVDLGDARYGVSPYEADQLTARMVHLLNRHGAR